MVTWALAISDSDTVISEKAHYGKGWKKDAEATIMIAAYEVSQGKGAK
jgi:hypothetical protein